jgi:hypothetical protein
LGEALVAEWAADLVQEVATPRFALQELLILSLWEVEVVIDLAAAESAASQKNAIYSIEGWGYTCPNLGNIERDSCDAQHS